MTTTLEHPLVRTMHEASLGRFPVPDGQAEVGGPLDGPCDAVMLFPHHLVTAAEIDPRWVHETLRRLSRSDTPDPSRGFWPFVDALATELGAPPQYPSVLLVAPHTAALLEGDLERSDAEIDQTWASYRTETKSYRYRSYDSTGTIGLGRGPGGRWDVYIAIERSSGASRAGRELLTAAKTLIPAGEVLYGSAPMFDIRVMRALLSARFHPICSEVLFLTRG